MPYGPRSYRPRQTTYRRGPRRSTRSFTRPVRKKVPYKFKKSLDVAVSRAISKRVENKHASVHFRPTTLPAIVGTTATFNIGGVIPPIAQGPGMFGNRIGNQIRPKYCTIEGYCTLDMTDQDHNYDRVGVIVTVGFPKRYHLYEDAISSIIGAPLDNWSYHLYDYGTDTGPSMGNLQTFQSPINHRVFTVKAQRKFELMRPRIWNAPLTGDDFARSTAGSYKMFKMRIKMPSVLNYNDSSTVRPEGFDPMVLMSYCCLNGYNPPSPAGAPRQVTFSYTTRMSYEDA